LGKVWAGVGVGVRIGVRAMVRFELPQRTWMIAAGAPVKHPASGPVISEIMPYGCSKAITTSFQTK